ncbi:MAG: OmpA family protein [Chitinophagaceae bacterium]|nr:OmpA family protein [Chitinophagaceae bacterium]
MRKILSGFLFIFSAITVNAQDNKEFKKSPTIAVFGGAYDFVTAARIRNTSLSKVLGNKNWADLNEMDFAFGVSYLNGINNYFDYSVNFFTGNSNYPARGAETSSRESFLSELDASIHMKLLTDKYVVVPYLSAGVGGSYWNKRFEAFMPLGAGLQVKLTEGSFLLSNFQYRVPVTQGANYHFMYNIGFGGSISTPKPAPEPKAVPVAPVVPEPPKDSDGDGIVDPEDKCPTVPGVAKYQGCPVPDTDKDGIDDDNDKCPTVAGIAKYQGCPIPDTDKDGINDEQDKCPTVAGLERYQGCPIPDTDGDGLNDEEDKCPSVAGLRELFGCPRPDFKAENVLFSTGSAVLVATGKKELDIAVDYLKQFQGFKVKIAGHTDNTGNPKSNKTLSEKRAVAAKNYLVSKGIDADRLITEGLGDTMPVADNKTSAGRKKNRRVEFSIVE